AGIMAQRFFLPSIGLLLSLILQAKHTGRSDGKLFTKLNEEAMRNGSKTTKAAIPPEGLRRSGS
ncbi:hypothetical protein, partial [Ruminococcus champanellensis]